MIIVHVHIHVKPECVHDFITASIDNSRNSLQEPGVAGFDVLQQTDDPSHFLLIEVYRDPEDVGKHKETAHYNQWREIAEPMMSEPRTRRFYSKVFPVNADHDDAI